MKETGIIMSGNHPQLIIDGQKTMTRRTYGLEEINQNPDRWEYMRTNNDGSFLFWVVANDPEPDIEKRIKLVKCPYGGVGDRLWVKATYAVNFKGQILFKYEKEKLTELLELPDIHIKWSPAMFMKREYSRILLEITEVRDERLNQMTEEDAIAEGIKQLHFTTGMKVNCLPQFIELWDSLNAKRGFGWNPNPWVWPIRFKLLEYK